MAPKVEYDDSETYGHFAIVPATAEEVLDEYQRLRQQGLPPHKPMETRLMARLLNGAGIEATIGS